LLILQALNEHEQLETTIKDLKKDQTSTSPSPSWEKSSIFLLVKLKDEQNMKEQLCLIERANLQECCRRLLEEIQKLQWLLLYLLQELTMKRLTLLSCMLIKWSRSETRQKLMRILRISWFENLRKKMID